VVARIQYSIFAISECVRQYIPPDVLVILIVISAFPFQVLGTE